MTAYQTKREPKYGIYKTACIYEPGYIGGQTSVFNSCR